MLDQIKKTVKHALIYSIGNAANKMMGFILLPLYTSTFSVALYGLLALFDTISDFLVAISTFGIMHGFKRWYWDEETSGKQKALFFTVLVFSVISSLVFLALFYFLLIKFDIAILGMEVTPLTLLLFCGSVFTNVMLQRILVLMRIQHRALENTLYSILKIVLVIASTVYFIVVLKWGLNSIFISRLIGQTIALIALLPIFIKNSKAKIDLDILKIFKKMLAYSWPLALSASLGLIFTFSDRWLLKGLVSLDAVGNYSLAYRIANIVKILVVQSFSQAFIYIYFRKMNSQKDYRYFSKSATYFTFMLMVLGLLIITFSKEIIHLLAQNADYYGSYNILPVLILSVSLSGLRQMIALPLNKHKKTRLISIISISAGALNIGLNFLLIPLWQEIGAALATAIAHLMVVIVYFIVNKKIADFNYEIPKIIFLFLIGALLAFISMQMDGIILWLRIPLKLLLVLMFPVILRVFGFYEDIELLRIRQIIRKWYNPLKWKENFKDINING